MARVVAVSEVIDAARRAAPSGSTCIIGIDGPSGAGKSTLAQRLVSLAEQVTLVEVDDFVSWRDFSGWWPRFDAEVLSPLLAGKDARYQVRDWQNDEFGSSLNGWKTAPWAPLVVVEGVTCTRHEAADRLAYRIWVDAPPDVRLTRGLARDGEDHRMLWEAWMVEEQRFFSADDTPARADLRVSGHPTVPHDPITQLVMEDDR